MVKSSKSVVLISLMQIYNIIIQLKHSYLYPIKLIHLINVKKKIN